MLFHREVSDNLNVCTSCGHHMAITPRDRFISLFDGGIFTEINVPTPIDDPLTFRDQKKYPDRMKAAQKGTGEKDAMLVGTVISVARRLWPLRKISRSWVVLWACMWATRSSRQLKLQLKLNAH